MRTQCTTKGNRDAGSSCLCDRGLHGYLRNFGGGGVENPKPPLGTPLFWSTFFFRTYIIKKQIKLLIIYVYIYINSTL